jgi:ABC-type dipeptide/oligopeptide/nickel transport system permease subunit
MIFITVFSFNILGDELKEAMDPQLRKGIRIINGA